MVTIKSILAIAATACMLVSATYATPTNIINPFKTISKYLLHVIHFILLTYIHVAFMGQKNKNTDSPFIKKNIKFTNTPYKVNGVYYIKGTQNKGPITLACKSDTIVENSAFKSLKENSKLLEKYSSLIAIPKEIITFSGNKCYVLPGQCAKTYKQFTKVFTSDKDLEKIETLWRKIADDICIDKNELGEYVPYFINFNNAIPVEKGIISIRETNEFVTNESLRLVPADVKVAITKKLYGSGDVDKWDDLSDYLGPSNNYNRNSGLIEDFTNAISRIQLESEKSKIT
ncbi:hypothetical protein BDF19DRAFT_415246 [Syncephalis fuscata]|nr:hypothetical protein BDF19DRAFT_415246 [Syncephalis fuscata]